MKSRFFNVLQLPVFFLFLAGVITLYGYVKFESLIPIEMQKVAKLQSEIHLLVDCKAINSDAILSIAQGKVESIKSLADVMFYFGFFCISLGITNFIIVIKYLTRSTATAVVTRP